ncbi:hypothetical protein AOLI_G00089470 [Acnodon oligacanthus]
MYVDPNNPRKLQISDVQPSDAGNYTCFPYHIQVQWILTVEVTESEPELHREMFLYIVPSVTGAAAVCIFCTVWIHRKQKKKEAVDVSGTRDEKAKALQTFLLHRETLTSCVYTKISPYEAALHSYSRVNQSYKEKYFSTSSPQLQELLHCALLLSALYGFTGNGKRRARKQGMTFKHKEEERIAPRTASILRDLTLYMETSNEDFSDILLHSKWETSK